MIELKHSELIHRIGTVEVDPLDQCRDFLQIARSGLDHDRVGADVGIDHHASRQPGTLFTFLIQILDHRRHLPRRSVLETEDLELGQRIDRAIEFEGEVDDRLQISTGSQHQHRVGLDHWHHRHRLAPLTRLGAGGVQRFVDRGQQAGQCRGIDVLEHDDLEIGDRRSPVPLEQLDQGHHLLDILLVANHHQPTVGQDLDLHLTLQPAQDRLHRRPCLRSTITGGRRSHRLTRLGFGLGFGLGLGLGPCSELCQGVFR